MTISDISELTGLNWKTIKEIDIFYTKQRIESLKNIFPTRIGIDEVAYEKGQKYLTVVRDLDLSKVIWVGLDRKEASLDAFFDELGWEKTLRIEVAVLDMWDPYIASLKSHCPHVDIVFDKFHIVKYINDALDEVRRKEFAKASDDDRKDMKRKRFLILMREEDLNDTQRERLDKLMKQNETLYKGYLLKEQISDILEGYDLGEAISRLEKWIQNVMESGVEPLIKCIKTIRHYFYGIANYFRHHVTNAGSEGFNTKINIIRRRAYGYSDLDYFILKIFQACGVMK
jgi:transposase